MDKQEWGKRQTWLEDEIDADAYLYALRIDLEDLEDSPEALEELERLYSLTSHAQELEEQERQEEEPQEQEEPEDYDSPCRACGTKAEPYGNGYCWECHDKGHDQPSLFPELDAAVQVQQKLF